jgi:transposase
MRRRRFTPEFKRSIIEQLLSETAGPAELCRRYNVSSGLLFTWKKQYAQGKLDSDPSREAELQARVRDLEQMLGKVTLENEFLKKALRNSLKQSETKDSSLPKTAASSAALKGGAN